MSKPIAFCITELDPGGAEQALYEVVTRLDREKWLPRVYCLGPETPLAEAFRQQGILVSCFGASSIVSFLGAFSWLKKELSRFDPQILQCFLFHGNVLGRIAGHQAKVPIIISGHRVAEREKLWHLWLDKLTRNYVHQHVAVSTGVQNHVAKRLGISLKSITVIGNGVNMPALPGDKFDFSEFGWDNENHRFLLAAGRLHPQKGFLTLIDSFAELKQEFPELKLLILGEGPQRSILEQRIRDLKLTNDVALPGYRHDLARFYNSAELFVLSSEWEGMANVLLQAMAHGCSIVATNVEGVSEAINDGEHGLIAQPGNTADLSRCIRQLLNEPELAQRCGHQARERAEKMFTWDHVAQQYESLFEAMLTKS